MYGVRSVNVRPKIIKLFVTDSRFQDDLGEGWIGTNSIEESDDRLYQEAADRHRATWEGRCL